MTFRDFIKEKVELILCLFIIVKIIFDNFFSRYDVTSNGKETHLYMVTILLVHIKQSLLILYQYLFSI
jgi:hypothetical protein